MPRVSHRDREALEALRKASSDASSAESLAARALVILERAIGFDEGYILTVDPDSLLFTRLLAYRGDHFPRFVHWLRDVYLIVERQILRDLAFPDLLRDHGGFVILHERIDRCAGSVRLPASQETWARAWRRSGSPPGGGFRFGFADRGRWVAAIQAARWRPGPGYEARELDILRRVGPSLARAFRSRLEREHRHLAFERTGPLQTGHLLFDPDRRLAYVDEPGEKWAERLADEEMRRHGMHLPIVAQSLVNELASDPAPEASSRMVDRHGRGVLVRATAARAVEPGQGPPGRWIQLSIQADPIASRLSIGKLTARQREVGVAVGEGLADRAIAERFGISPATVHEHVGALHGVFGTATRPELVAALSSSPHR
jgi:DNA-binding CsgD family transcriptional regulator